MPNCDFYAVRDDLRAVLDFIFTESECRVFESFSRFDQDLCEFSSTDELAGRYPLGVLRGTAQDPLLQLVPNRQFAAATTRRITLIPEKCNGATFRYCIEGWGLIQFYLGGVSPVGLVESHTNHNSQQRALAWEPTCGDDLGSVRSWDWAEVTRISSRINRRIRRLGVTRLGSRPVLPEAARLIAQGMSPYGFMRTPPAADARS